MRARRNPPFPWSQISPLEWNEWLAPHYAPVCVSNRSGRAAQRRKQSFQPEGPVPLGSKLPLTSACHRTRCPTNPCFYLQRLVFGTGCSSGRPRLKMQFSIFITTPGQISDLSWVFERRKAWSCSDTRLLVGLQLGWGMLLKFRATFSSRAWTPFLWYLCGRRCGSSRRWWYLP